MRSIERPRGDVTELGSLNAHREIDSQKLYQLMQKLLQLLILLITLPLTAQVVTTNPAAPTDDAPVTITFDASQGDGGLFDCNCDVYLHTGVILEGSNEWQEVPTTWGVENEAWRMQRVDGEANVYTYTYGPTLREYFDLDDDQVVRQLAMLFRDGPGNRAGRASGGGDIFIDVTQGDALGINIVGLPEQPIQALGRPLPVRFGATRAADLSILVGDEEVASSEDATELITDVILTEPGEQTIRFVATSPDGSITVEEEFDITGRLEVTFTQPTQSILEAAPGTTVTLAGTSYLATDLTLEVAGAAPIELGNTSAFERTVTIPEGGVSTYTITSTYRGSTALDRVTFVTGGPEEQDAPSGFTPGATDMANGNVMLQLRAPGKQDVFVVHNFNGYTPTASSRAKRGSDGTFWLELTDLPEGEDLIYQFLIDGDITQPDPYSKLVLDPFNDRFIDAATFPDLPAYPENMAAGILTWHRRGVAPYNWQSDADYERPDPERMVIYELLVRDFVAAHNFQTLTDTLDYLDRLGVNVIELMPVNEFEGNLSWGYNPSFHGALDKYYGSPEALKAFVDACHERGIAVVVDIVYNHAFSQSPLARLWWDQEEFRPTADNPYLNVEARHPFNVGYDFNHESELTKEYVKVTTQYWQEEFRIDGFRWDLSKGFTQNNTGSDVGAWNRYDAERIAILKDYADHVWSVDDEAYMIMEHLGESREEDELAQHGNGMYFWSGFNPHDEYLEASMGYESDLRSALAQNRGFTDRNLVAYMESHDEERMMYKNTQFANMDGSYNIRQIPTGLDRVELASSFFYTLPGPKMLWQFGELGYDFSINYCEDGTINESCRTGNKPIRWDYAQDQNRLDVYEWVADLNYLRNNFDILHGTVSGALLTDRVKRFRVSGSDGTAVVVGNFGVTSTTATGVFPSTGTWYDYATGEAREVASAGAPIQLAAGEHHVYLSRPIARGGGNLGVSTNAASVERLQLRVLPNPSNGAFTVAFDLPGSSQINVELRDLNGRLLKQLHQGLLPAGAQQLGVDAGAMPAGMYLLRVTDGIGSGVRKVIIR